MQLSSRNYALKFGSVNNSYHCTYVGVKRLSTDQGWHVADCLRGAMEGFPTFCAPWFCGVAYSMRYQCVAVFC